MILPKIQSLSTFSQKNPKLPKITVQTTGGELITHAIVRAEFHILCAVLYAIFEVLFGQTCKIPYLLFCCEVAQSNTFLSYDTRTPSVSRLVIFRVKLACRRSAHF